MTFEEERRHASEPRGRQAPPTRERVMDVAEAQLSAFGYRGLSLAEVASEVGFTKAALYYHFPEGKEELVVALLHRSLRRIGDGLEDAMGAAEGGPAKLAAAARWLMTEPERGHNVGKLHDVARFVDERHHATLADGFYRAHYQPIRAAVASAIESGEFRKDDPDFLAWSFLSLVSGLMEAQETARTLPAPLSGAAGDARADQMIELFLRGALR